MIGMDARGRFTKGQRVKASEDSPLRERQTKTGVVVGFGREPYIVRVLRDKIKTAESWHESFWEPVR